MKLTDKEAPGEYTLKNRNQHHRNFIIDSLSNPSAFSIIVKERPNIFKDGILISGVAAAVIWCLLIVAFAILKIIT